MSGLGPRLLILSAPSGAGKTTLAHRLLAEIRNSRLSVSMTTRAPRGRERDGSEYHFVSDEEFRKQIASGGLLEWAEVHGNLYGTPRANFLADPACAWTLFDIDVQGGNRLAGQFPGAVTVFVLPPSMEILEGRLRGRRTETEADIARRLAASREEIRQGLASYRYAVVNHDIDEALRDVKSIVRAEELLLAVSGKDLEQDYGQSGLRGEVTPQKKDG